jgi:hypothetical protein
MAAAGTGHLSASGIASDHNCTGVVVQPLCDADYRGTVSPDAAAFACAERRCIPR